jgi:hypothetical protein
MSITTCGMLKKLLSAKFAKIKLHQGALQTTFPVFPDIFDPRNFGYLGENGLFSTPTGRHT